MPFLGTTPTQGFVSSFPKQSFTPDGSTTVFTLTNPVATANDLEVFVGNVGQAPTTAYTAAGTTLTMSEAPASGLNFYVINKSFAQVTTTPPVNSISTDKIQNNAVTAAKIPNSAISLSGSKVTGTLPVASGGTGITSGFINGGITQASAVSTSGAANYNITGIPTTAQKIMINLYSVRPAASGTSRYLEWRLINESGTAVTSSYFNHHVYQTHSGSSNVSYNNNVNSFRLDGWPNQNNVWYGTIYLEYYTGFGNDIWNMRGTLWNSGYTQYLLHMSGFCSGAGANPSGVRLMTSTGGNFDSGQFTVSYQ